MPVGPTISHNGAPMRSLAAGLPAFLALACSPGEEGPPGPPTTILLTLDTTRADHLGAYGHAAARTPVLDRIAEEGALFLDASATAPTTLPSHASILTGLFPPSHGARNNGNHFLPPGVETVAEVFQRAGYATGAFVAAEVLSARYGLDQGFDHYDDDFLHDATAFGEGYRERSAGTVVERALSWIDAQGERPLFCWLHFFDPHFPYDAEIARVDEAIGALVEALRGAGRYGSATVAVVADHGEGLGDKGEDTHGLFVYQATIHVPLLLRAPERIPEGAKIAEPVSTVDLAPTLLELAGLGVPAAVQGRSLLPLWTEGPASDRTIYFETLLPRYEYMWSNLAGMRSGTAKFIEAPTDELYRLDADPGERTNVLGSADTVEWNERFASLVRGFEPPPAPTSLEVDGGTREELAALGYGFAPIVVDDARPLPDPKEHLGRHRLYREIQGAVRGEDWRRVLTLTAEGLRPSEFDAYQALFAARARTHLDDPGGAEALYRELLRRFPDDATLLRDLASLQFRTKQLAAARDTYERLIELDPLHPLHHAGLGDVLMSLGNAEGARAAWEAALEADPYHVKSLNNLGILAAQAGDFATARARFERILLLEPDHAQARANLQRLAQDERK